MFRQIKTLPRRAQTVLRERVISLGILASATVLATSSVGPVVAQEVRFIVRVENVSNDNTLMLPDGKATGAPIAPGAFAVYRKQPPIFRVGAPAGKAGLEALAEDGNAESLAKALKKLLGVTASGVFVPGQPFTFTARPGDKLSFATMFVQSNDLFYGPDGAGVDLFDSSGKPASGDVTALVALYDAGTEVNEAPGVGLNQAPRQSRPNTGPTEHKPVHPVNDRYTYPPISAVIKVTISPN